MYARRPRSRKPARRARKGRRVALRRRARPARRQLAEWASANQTIQLNDDPMNQIIQLDDINLSQFDRLSAIAQNYQSFRFTGIELKLKPYADTFATTAGEGQAVPYLNYLIDKGENLVPVTGPAGFNQLRDAGAKPIRFDEKTITIAWKPRVPMVSAYDSSSTPTFTLAMASRISPWLATNATANLDPSTWLPSTIPHKGIYYGVEQAFVIPGGDRTYGCEITVHAQFRRPQFRLASGEYSPALKKPMVPKDA